MNYTSIYNSLIENAKARALNEYTESHHIIPKCMGGADDASNLVDLTPKEHYVAHHLLTKMYPENVNILYAFWAMCTLPRDKVKVSAKVYSKVRADVIDAKRKNVWWNDGATERLCENRPSPEFQMGRIEVKWWNDGVNQTQSPSQPGPDWVAGRINNGITGIVWWTNGTEEKKSRTCPGDAWCRGRLNRSEEYKQNMKLSTTGIVWWTNGTEEKKSRTCPGTGYVRGRKKKNES